MALVPGGTGAPGTSRQRLALRVEYEGTRYCGFQVQRSGPSVQGELERALERLTGTFTRITAAGRTDTGVHALGQVVAFTTTAAHHPQVFLRALNYYLPQDIAVREVHPVTLSFHPRRHARARTYRYAMLSRGVPSPLLRRFTHWVPQPLAVEAMTVAARTLEGERDFAPFGGPLPPGRGTVRRLRRCQVWQRHDLVLLEMEATAFLPGQVRRTAGALVQVGLGRTSVEEFTTLARTGAPGSAGPALPPQGLCLLRVTYDDLPSPPAEAWPPGCIHPGDN